MAQVGGLLEIKLDISCKLLEVHPAFASYQRPEEGGLVAADLHENNYINHQNAKRLGVEDNRIHTHALDARRELFAKLKLDSILLSTML